MKKLLFIYNPKAGKTQIKYKLGEIVEILAKKYEITIVSTQKPKDAIIITKEKGNNYDLIVCAGGDGTLDEVAEGLVLNNIDKPIGYIPCGSTNDIANSIGLSKNIKKATNNIANGKNHFYDYGLFNNKVFVYVAAFGLFTDVSYGTNQDLKNALGHFAYVLEGVKRLSDIKSYHLKIKYNNEIIEDDFVLGLISSSKSIGGIKMIDTILPQEVALDDGLFEVSLVRLPKTFQDLNDTMQFLSNPNKEMKNSSIYSFSTSHLEIETMEPISWTLDGEYGGEHKIVNIKNVNKGLKLYH